MSAKAILLSQAHIKFTGKNVAAFLQGQFTCDVNEINSSQTRLAAHCDPKGRMQCLGRLYLFQNEYYYSLPASLLDICMEKLKPYAILSRVNMTAMDWISIGLSDAEANLAALNSLPTGPDSCIEYNNVLIIKVQGDTRYQLIGIQEAVDPILRSLELKIESNETTWLEAEIKQGQAFLMPETVGKFLPHDINLPQLNGVSFNKGCYIGQEIIARMQYLGKLKKQLWLVESQDAFHCNQAITDSSGKVLGEIVCYVKTSYGCLGLASFNQAPAERTYYLGSSEQLHLIRDFFIE